MEADPFPPLPNLKKDLVAQMNKVQQGRSKLRNSISVKVWSYKDGSLFSLNVKRDNGRGLWPGRFMSDMRKNFFTKKE